MTKSLLVDYLHACRERRSTGAVTPETSLYSPLETLLNEVGRTLKPRVRCFMNLKNLGGDMPDGGLFTPDQLAKGSGEVPAGQTPARGVIECKKPKDEIADILRSEQVARYLNRYEQVLVTNYRAFVLVGKDSGGKPIRREAFELVATEAALWSIGADALAKELEEPFIDFLKRVILHPAPISAP